MTDSGSHALPSPSKPWSLRGARESEAPALESLLRHSAQTLLPRHYTPHQIRAAFGPVFGVDRQLIRDGTYFVVEHEGALVGCGGWSRRCAHYGGDGGRPHEAAWLDPVCDAARIRAFFVHPSHVRRGIGRRLLEASEGAAVLAGFRRLELVATLAGEPLYAACGYEVLERLDLPLAEGLSLPVTRMGKDLRDLP